MPATETSRDRGLDDAIAQVERGFTELFRHVKSTLKDRAARVHPQLQPFGYHVLGAVVRHGPLHATRLAEMFSTDKSAISRTVSQLETMGLVSRETDPNDKRAAFVVATDEGRRRVDAVVASDREVLYERLRGWPREDIDRLGDLLSRLTETLTD